MANKYFEGFAGFLARQIISAGDYFELTYKHGRGHFKVEMYLFITSFSQRDFKKVVEMMESSDSPQVVAGYVNSIIKKIYAEVKTAYDKFTEKLTDGEKVDSKEYQYLSDALSHLEKRNAMLVKAFDVSPLGEEVKQEVQEVAPVESSENESSENMTPLKKCNVVRYIPTQVNPVWKYGLIETHVGYHFEYRGMPLQAYTTDGWCKNDADTTVFIVDPVIGLPVTHYDGALSDIEEVLAGAFIKYLQTIESNKEAIVQIARAFEDLKRQSNTMTA